MARAVLAGKDVRIAILSTPFVSVPPPGYGGTELFCYELAEELLARGHAVTLYATGDSHSSCRTRALYPRPEWPPTPFDEVSHVAWSFEDLRGEDVDVVHLNSALGVPLTRLLDVPVVHTIHHHRVDQISRVYAAHPRVTYVAISHRQIALEAKLADAVVIHHGLSAERYPPSLRDEGYLLHLGRFAESKGTHLAIELSRACELPLKLAGRTHPEDADYFAARVAPLLGTPDVTEVGEVDVARKVPLLQGARALVCPLQWEEPFGLVAIEAMLCGTPVLGFARGSFPEIVDEGITGALAPPGDLDALVRLTREVGHIDRRACARRARERFSTTVMAGAYEALYARVAGLRVAGNGHLAAHRRASVNA